MLEVVASGCSLLIYTCDALLGISKTVEVVQWGTGVEAVLCWRW
jgi:hypothetical protein